MRKSEIALLLGVCATFDRRTVGEMDVEAWWRVLGDLDLEPCREAVYAHYGTTGEWIMPSDIRDQVKGRRLTPTPKLIPLPAADPDDVPAYLAALRSGDSIDIEPGPGVGALPSVRGLP